MVEGCLELEKYVGEGGVDLLGRPALGQESHLDSPLGSPLSHLQSPPLVRPGDTPPAVKGLQGKMKEEQIEIAAVVPSVASRRREKECNQSRGTKGEGQRTEEEERSYQEGDQQHRWGRPEENPTVVQAATVALAVAAIVA